MSAGLIRSATDVAHLDPPSRACVAGLKAAQFGVTLGTPLPDVANGRHQICLDRPAAQQAAQVMALGGEQTQVELALSGQTGPVAAATKAWVTLLMTPISPALRSHWPLASA